MPVDSFRYSFGSVTLTVHIVCPELRRHPDSSRCMSFPLFQGIRPRSEGADSPIIRCWIRLLMSRSTGREGGIQDRPEGYSDSTASNMEKLKGNPLTRAPDIARECTYSIRCSELSPGRRRATSMTRQQLTRDRPHKEGEGSARRGQEGD